MSFELYFDYTMAGYQQFRSGLHENCLTGLIHCVYMPLAAIGFFNIIAYIEMNLNPRECYTLRWTRKTKNCLLIFYWLCYMNTFPIIGTLTIFIYYVILTWALNLSTYKLFKAYNKHEAKLNILKCGLYLLIISIGILEFFSHWYLEQHSSRINELFNSILHTPVYGINSLYYPYINQCKF